jgi:toxin FitB
LILVDTNVWSEQTKLDCNPAVEAWLEANDAELVLSTLVIAEIRYGIALSKSEAKRAALESWVDGLESRYWSQTLDFDKTSAHRFGRIAASREAKARDPQVIDMQLAAQAEAYGATIATRNVRDFEWTGVRVVNPWEG